MSPPADSAAADALVGLVVIAHAPFATSLVDCARHVYACPPDRCVVVDVAADANVETETARAKAAVASVDGGAGVLVLVDLFGATPGNVAGALASAGRVEVVAGANLPMLLRVLCYRRGARLVDLAEKAVHGGASGIMKIAATTAPSHQNSRLFPHDPDDGPVTHGDARLQDQ